MMEIKKGLPFDKKSALDINKARMFFLEKFLQDCNSFIEIKSVIDCGCGIGYFSNFLSNLGYLVTGFDVRKENIREAKNRFIFSNINFEIGNIEDVNFMNHIKPADFVLCFGLLYHLENPFLALRNLKKVFNKVMVLETMIYPSKDAIAVYKKEFESLDQGVNYSALLPSSLFIIKILEDLNLGYVYEVNNKYIPHTDFKDSIFKKTARKIFIVSKIKLPFDYLKLVSAKSSDFTRNLDYYRLFIKLVFKFMQKLRLTLKNIRK